MLFRSQTMFNSILKLKNESEIIQSVKLLREQIESYELLLFHSLNMIASLINGDQLTFYKIYVSFDKLNIFNSNPILYGTGMNTFFNLFPSEESTALNV